MPAVLLYELSIYSVRMVEKKRESAEAQATSAT
jgi:Sec-independent protein secretion pathway component TatC